MTGERQGGGRRPSVPALVVLLGLACSAPVDDGAGDDGARREGAGLGAAEPVDVSSGSRSFERWIALEDSGATSANVSIGDLDADGHLDLLLVKGRHWPLDNLVLLGDGDGGFRLGGTFGRGEWSTRHLRVGDLNGDGHPDAVLANRYGPQEGPSHLCLGEEGGRFQQECRVVTHGSATTIVPADVDGDGDLDLVVPHRDGGQSFVYHNDGGGAFQQREPFGPADAAIRSALPLHVDDDGLVDLVVIDEATGPAIFRGREGGGYGEGEPLGSMDARPYALGTADVDGNGRTDILIGFVGARPMVWFNDGPASLVSVPFGDDLGSAYGFDVGDLDEDGFMDIALARSGAPNVLYFGAPSAR